MKYWTASAVHPILEVSMTYLTPFLCKVAASSAFNSFWIAQGKAISTGTSQGFFPGMNLAPNFSANGATTSLFEALNSNM